MGESLIDKYPHLKTLLEDNEVDDEPPQPSRGKSGGKSLLGPGGPVTTKSSVRTTGPRNTERKKLFFKAEQLFARSMGADSDHWLGFQVQEKLSARQQLEQLQVWLASNKPSLVQRSSGVGWIAVKLGDKDRRVKSAQAKAEWDGLKGERSMESVNKLAVKYGDTGGKWLFHVDKSRVDKSWEKLALAMLSGGLGPSVSMVKVSPRGEEDSHVVIVYNNDYQDSTQVMRIENLLRSAGVLEDLLYKPDIFSTLGIYRNNVWGFRPTIYSSTMMKATGKSRVTVAGTGKSYFNTSKGLDVRKDENLNKIVAHISNDKDVRNKTEKKQATGKKVVKVDENKNKKKVVKESEEKKTKEKECPMDGQWMKDLGMLDLRSLDEF